MLFHFVAGVNPKVVSNVTLCANFPGLLALEALELAGLAHVQIVDISYGVAVAPLPESIKAFLADVFVCAPGTVLYAANVACDIGFRIVQVVSPFAQFAGGVSDRDIVVALRALFFAQTAL